MNVLLIGGAGYVGSACLRYLLSHGYEAFAFDNLCQGHAAAVPQGRLIQGDILDRPAIEQALQDTQAEAVMHFAAAASVSESVTDPAQFYNTNVFGSYNVLEAMRAVSVRRLVFSSTSSTYGIVEKMPMSERTPQDPCNPYGRTKLAVEWMIADFARAYGLGYAFLRYFNAAGAAPDGDHGESHEPEHHLIPVTLQVALGERERITVYGSDYPTADGTCVRDFVHVDDLAEAHRLAVEQVAVPGGGGAFNVGTGQGHSVLEVIRACEAATGLPIPHTMAGRRPGDPAELVADPAKLMTELDWRPKYASLQSIVETAWKWHKRHPEGYGDERAPEELASASERN